MKIMKSNIKKSNKVKGTKKEHEQESVEDHSDNTQFNKAGVGFGNSLKKSKTADSHGW